MRNEKRKFESRTKHKPTVGEKVMAKENNEQNAKLNLEPYDDGVGTYFGGQI